MYQVKLTAEGAEYVNGNEEEWERVKAMAHPVTGFREFLNVWKFRPPGEESKILGEDLWPGQDQFVDYVQKHGWIYLLKAAQIGFTTIEEAYDGWVARFRGANERVHIYSKREDAAQSYLEHVKFGLENLPWWMRMPVIRETLSEYVIGGYFGDAADEDLRTIKAYPSDSDTSRGDPCTHSHVDEWAFMGNPRKVMQAIEPRSHGTMHILTTGQGPQNYTSEYFRRSLDGETPHQAVFIDALQRPDRTEAWLTAKRASLGDELAALQEYPMKWQDALSGGGTLFFRHEEIEAAGRDYLGIRSYEEGHRYVIAWDIGKIQDAAVGIVLDVTDRGDVKDVVRYKRLRQQTYPMIQREIAQDWRDYPGAVLAVESNAAGEAVLDNLDLPESVIEDARFKQTPASKARILSQLKLEFQNQTIKYDPDACHQLDSELRGYQLPDDNVVQDSVIALAIAVDKAPAAWYGATLLTPFHV